MENTKIMFRDCPVKRGLSGKFNCRRCKDNDHRPSALLNLGERKIDPVDFENFPAPCFPCGLYTGDCPLMIWIVGKDESPCRNCLIENLNEPCFDGCPVKKEKEPCRICPNLEKIVASVEAEKAWWRESQEGFEKRKAEKEERIAKLKLEKKKQAERKKAD